MIGNKWFCEPNDEREPWCFLWPEWKELEGERTLSGWKISYGNSRKILRSLSSEGKEEEVLRDLEEELHYCQRKGVTVFTFSDDAFKAIRNRYLLAGIESIGLRDTENISIEHLLSENFHNLGPDSGEWKQGELPSLCEEIGIQADDRSCPELIWRVLLKIGPLLPEGSLNGVLR